MKSAFDKIIAGIDDVTAFAKGEKSNARVVKPVDIKELREKRAMTQHQFSRKYRLPLGTVRDWEQHRREPDTGSRVYLSLIDADPEGVEEILNKVIA